MKILAIRTDKPEAELYIYQDHKQLKKIIWQADRQLTETLHQQLAKILDLLSISLADLNGVVCYKGPGSFTGLRIGLTVGNALAYSQDMPVVAADGNQWIKQGITKLLSGQNERLALPKYGAPAKTSRPKM
jgi:tRNA threonylcarbamoyladenosine biosynthesis protein TsaB